MARFTIETRAIRDFPVVVTGFTQRACSDSGEPAGVEITDVLTRQGRSAGFITSKMSRREWDDLHERVRDAL